MKCHAPLFCLIAVLLATSGCRSGKLLKSSTVQQQAPANLLHLGLGQSNYESQQSARQTKDILKKLAKNLRLAEPAQIAPIEPMDEPLDRILKGVQNTNIQSKPVKSKQDMLPGVAIADDYAQPDKQVSDSLMGPEKEQTRDLFAQIGIATGFLSLLLLSLGLVLSGFQSGCRYNTINDRNNK